VQSQLQNSPQESIAQRSPARAQRREPSRTGRSLRPSAVPIGERRHAAGSESQRPAMMRLSLQRSAGNRATAQLLAGESVHRVTSQAGEELEPEVRVDMEQRLGADFSAVRIHRDADAGQSAQALDAHAYAAGEHVVFAPGRYNPASSSGKHILAHELAHVVQQRSGPVSGVPIGGDVSVSQPNDAFEQAADATAKEAMASPKAGEGSGRASSSTNGTIARMVIQREDDQPEEAGKGAGTQTADTADSGAAAAPIEQIATAEDINLLKQIIDEGKSSRGAEEKQTAQTSRVSRLAVKAVQTRLAVQRWSVWNCFGDKANVAAAVGAVVAAGAGTIAALLAPDPTTITKWVAIGIAAGIIAAIAWLISAIIGLMNCWRAQDDAAQHQQEIESLQRQIDQLRRTLERLERLRSGGQPAPAPTQ
jgi:hypothetical protein